MAVLGIKLAACRRKVVVMLPLLMVWVGGCAQDPYDAPFSPSGRMNEECRTIGLAVISTAEPKLTLLTRESLTSSDIDWGTEKGIKTWSNGLNMFFGPLGAGLGLVLWPVGALGGILHEAASVGTTEMTYSLSETEGANDPSRDGASGLRFESILHDRIIRIARGKTNCVFRTIPYQRFGNPPPSLGGVDPVLKIAVQDCSLVGDEGEDPRVQLRMSVWAYANSASDTSAGPLIYAGRKRKLSAWAADDGRLLREEFDQAAQSLAEQIVERVFAG